MKARKEISVSQSVHVIVGDL